MKYLAAALAFVFAVGLSLAAVPASASARYNCRGCPPAKKYDNRQVIKTKRVVDHSRVINTTSVVYRPSQRRMIVSDPPPTTVNFVVHRYRIVHRPHPDSEIRMIYTPKIYTPKIYTPKIYAPKISKPHCKYGVSRNGSCVLRVRG